MRRPGPLLLLLAALTIPVAPAAADPAPAGAPPAPPAAVEVPSVEGLVLDGRLDEPAWSGAALVPTGTLDVPVSPGGGEGGETRPLRTEARLLVSGGALWIGASADEPPGAGIGVSGLLATRGTTSAADAVSFAFAPEDVRSLRFRVLGPRGAGRGVYRFQGAAAVRELRRWSVEVRVPLADLGVAGKAEAIRLALVVRSRDPALVAFAPPGAAWSGPETWLRILPGGGGAWPAGDAGPAAADLAKEDQSDVARVGAWSDFLLARKDKVEDLVPADHAHEPAVVLDAVKTQLLEPLGRILALRPDLAMAHVVEGHVLAVLGQFREARAAYEAALALVPGLLEARYGRSLEVDGPRLAAGTPGQATDYEGARRRAEQAKAEAKDAFEEDGAAFGLGLLALDEGRFEDAEALLAPLAARYPFAMTVVGAAERAREGAKLWPREVQRRRADAKKDDLPRVRLETDRGDIVLELYEDDVPNLVKHFVWLVEHGFYDGMPVGHTVPFLGAFVGDGVAGPGYHVARETATTPGMAPGTTEPRRPLFRGTVTFVSPSAAAEGSSFLILTGSALHLGEDEQAFGRVLEGQDAADRLQEGDHVRRATVVRKRPGVEYRPQATDGQPAPPPQRPR